MPKLSHLVVLLMLAAGCSSDGGSPGGTGGSGSGGPPGSCARGKNSCSPGTEFCCADYAGSFTASMVQGDCDDARVSGEYSSDPCTTENLEASCTLYKGTAAEKTIRYYEGYDALSKSDPVTNCSALHGTYEAAE